MAASVSSVPQAIPLTLIDTQSLPGRKLRVGGHQCIHICDDMTSPAALVGGVVPNGRLARALG